MSTLLSPPPLVEPLPVQARAQVFEDPRSRALLAELARLAAEDTPVLVTGPAGTGKALAARHLHQASGRAGPFVSLECRTLGEAALLGTSEGAGPHGGAFGAARGGTLFLAEVAELAPALQARLAQALQGRQAGVRIVAATRIELSRAVEAGRFRRDLWTRLGLSTVALPTLAERPGDIAPLARHFVQSWSARLGRPAATLSADGVAALQAHDWPGNLHELEEVVHDALLVNGDGVLRAADLRLAGARPAVPETATRLDRGPTAELDAALRALLRSGLPELHTHVEHRLIHAAYTLCGHNQVHTARLLGISRNVLRAQLIRFGYLTQTGDRRAVRPRGLRPAAALGA